MQEMGFPEAHDSKFPQGSIPQISLAVERLWCFCARIMMAEKVHLSTNKTPPLQKAGNGPAYGGKGRTKGNARSK